MLEPDSEPYGDMSRIAVSRVIGEGVFDYKYTWRNNSDIIGSFIGCMVIAKVNFDAIIDLHCNIFDPTWRKGLEQVVCSIDTKLRIPLPERYMELPSGLPELKVAFCFPSLIIRENYAFYREWPKMEASIQFLLRWRGIVEEENKDWLINYLKAFNAYI